MRKEDTRTKIQLGGLILKSGLADLLDITPGDDLQLDPIKKESAYILLGLLAEARDKAKEEASLTYYRSKGQHVAGN